MAAWNRARSMSTALYGLKLLSSMQQHQHHANPLAPLFPPMGGSPSLSNSSPCPTPPGRTRSVLHPDNQRALARQGFYGDQLPEGLEGVILLPQDGGDGKSSGRKKNAEDRRKQFHKARSKREHSLVESGEEECGDSYSRDSHMKSVDFSTTTESTDSGGDLSTSAPTTPGDVFLDRATSPMPHGGYSYPGERFPDMEDLYYLRRRSSPPGSLSRLSDGRGDPDSDVTPCASRQPTMEKAPTLTPSQGDEEGVEGDVGGGDGGGGSRTSTSTDPKNTVSIVVSEDVRRHQVTLSSSSPLKSLGGGRGGMNFLNIVNAAVDRLSDSGSEHTLVDQQSSSSGSPRPAIGSESPGLFPDSPRGGMGGGVGGGTTASGSQQRTRVVAGGGGGPPVPCPEKEQQGCGTATRQLEPSPVVYKTDSDPSPSARDENDNLPQHPLSKQVGV
ncbi:hypothetical protein ACOMHN_009823 [Nucella lapillus]